MELHNLKPATGSTKNRKRIGRGEGSKKGGTSTRGHKGAKSRSGYSKKLDLKGGSNLYREEFLNLDLLIQIELNIIV